MCLTETHDDTAKGVADGTAEAGVARASEAVDAETFAREAGGNDSEVGALEITAAAQTRGEDGIYRTRVNAAGPLSAMQSRETDVGGGRRSRPPTQASTCI